MPNFMLQKNTNFNEQISDGIDGDQVNQIKKD